MIDVPKQVVSREGFNERPTTSVPIENCLNEGVHPKHRLPEAVPADVGKAKRQCDRLDVLLHHLRRPERPLALLYMGEAKTQSPDAPWTVTKRHWRSNSNTSSGTGRLGWP